MFNFNSKKSTRTFPIATRIVKTSRWVHRNELKVGMYVRELDVAWEDTPFMFQGFVIDSVKMLNEVQEVAEYVCVESEKLAQISADSTNRLCAATRS